MRYSLSLLLFLLVAPSAYANFYPAPGVIAYRDGKWVGSDHLYNVGDSIPIYVEIVGNPESKSTKFTADSLDSIVKKVFEKQSIKTAAREGIEKPPLPYFHLLLMVYPVENGVTFFISGRLFETIKIDRVVPASGTFLQAITWEKQTMVFAKSEEIEEKVNNITEEIAQAFVDRYAFFKKIKS